MATRIKADIEGGGTAWIDRQWLEDFGRDEVQRAVFDARGGPLLSGFGPPRRGMVVEALGEKYKLVEISHEGRSVWERQRGSADPSSYD